MKARVLRECPCNQMDFGFVRVGSRPCPSPLDQSGTDKFIFLNRRRVTTLARSCDDAKYADGDERPLHEKVILLLEIENLPTRVSAGKPISNGAL